MSSPSLNFWGILLFGELERLTCFDRNRFLSYVDLVGVTYSAPSLATGFGAHLATPLLRKELDSRGPDGEKELSEEEALKIVRNCMKVLFYRDARSLNKVSRQPLRLVSRVS